MHTGRGEALDRHEEGFALERHEAECEVSMEDSDVSSLRGKRVITSEYLQYVRKSFR